MSEHGTLSKYQYEKCRCDKCVAVKRDQWARLGKAQRAKRNAEIQAGTYVIKEHGKEPAFRAGCRCEQCARYGRNKWLRDKYKISIDDYELLLKRQNGVCAICFRIPDKWCVDHDHTTGKVRGLLCHNCNVAIGHFYDDPVRMREALKYLTRV